MTSLDATKSSLIADHEFLALRDGGWATVQQVGNTIEYETFDAKGKSNSDAETLISARGTLEHIEFHSAARNERGDTYVLFTATDKETGDVGIYSQVFDRNLDKYDQPLLLNGWQAPEADAYSGVIALGNGRFVATWDHATKGFESIYHGFDTSIQDADGDVIAGGMNPVDSDKPMVMDFAAVGTGKFVRAYEESNNIYFSLYTLSQTKNDDGTYDIADVTTRRGEAYQLSAHRDANVCGLANGDFVITYEYFDKKGDTSALYQHVFNKNGSSIDLGLFQFTEDRLVSTTSYHQTDADTVGLADGGWATVWRQGSDDGNAHDIYLKAYSAEGYGQTLDIKVNTEAGNCKAPEVTALSNGNALVGWTQGGQLQQQVIDLSGNAIYGSAALGADDDGISGTGARDKIYGLDGYDTILGQAGDDLIDGGEGIDTMKGGRGNDTYFVDTSEDVIAEENGNGNDTVKTLVSLSLGKYLHVENVKLLGVLDLDAEGNSLNNHLTGNSGNNILAGGDGDDILKGWRGFDTLSGGKGHDIFVFHPNDDRDSITDFDLGEDKIDLSAFSDLHSLRDLAISQNDRGDLVVDVGGGDRIVLEGIDQLTEKQLLFAA